MFVNEVSPSVFCAWEYLETDKWTGKGNDRTMILACGGILTLEVISFVVSLRLWLYKWLA